MITDGNEKFYYLSVQSMSKIGGESSEKQMQIWYMSLLFIPISEGRSAKGTQSCVDNINLITLDVRLRVRTTFWSLLNFIINF